MENGVGTVDDVGDTNTLGDPDDSIDDSTPGAVDVLSSQELLSFKDFDGNDGSDGIRQGSFAEVPFAAWESDDER